MAEVQTIALTGHVSGQKALESESYERIPVKTRSEELSRRHLSGSGPGWGCQVPTGGWEGGFAMDALVPHQVGLAAKALATLLAGEGARARVDGLVADQVGFGAEAAGTDNTRVGATARVHGLVAAQV